MARYEFRFVITDVELSEEHQQKVSRAIAEAGAMAVAELTPAGAVTLPYLKNLWWRGIPPEPLREAIRISLGEVIGRTTHIGTLGEHA